MDSEGAHATTMRVLIGPDAGAPTFVMRMFEIAPGGHTPLHQHQWEHEVFVLDGEGEVASSDERIPLEPRAAVFVAPGEEHQFVNAGRETLRFLCLIPLQVQPC
jgi:quercetin dioxygenase-like cupin family protein